MIEIASIAGTFIGSSLLNSGVTATLRKGFNQTISYTPALLSGAASATTLWACHYIEARLYNEQQMKFHLTVLGAQLLIGTAVPKLFGHQVSLTHACALGVLSFFTSIISGTSIIAWQYNKNILNENIKYFTNHAKSIQWLLGM